MVPCVDVRLNGRQRKRRRRKDDTLPLSGRHVRGVRPICTHLPQTHPALLCFVDECNVWHPLSPTECQDTTKSPKRLILDAVSLAVDPGLADGLHRTPQPFASFHGVHTTLSASLKHTPTHTLLWQEMHLACAVTDSTFFLPSRLETGRRGEGREARVGGCETRYEQSSLRHYTRYGAREARQGELPLTARWRREGRCGAPRGRAYRPWCRTTRW